MSCKLSLAESHETGPLLFLALFSSFMKTLTIKFTVAMT